MMIIIIITTTIMIIIIILVMMVMMMTMIKSNDYNNNNNSDNDDNNDNNNNNNDNNNNSNNDNTNNNNWLLRFLSYLFRLLSLAVMYVAEIFNEVSLNLPIDILGCVPGKTQVGSLPELFANSICDQLCVMEKCLTKYRQVIIGSLSLPFLHWLGILIYSLCTPFCQFRMQPASCCLLPCVPPLLPSTLANP